MDSYFEGIGKSTVRRRLDELRRQIQASAQSRDDDELGSAFREFVILREMAEDPELQPVVEGLLAGVSSNGKKGGAGVNGPEKGSTTNGEVSQNEPGIKR